MSDLRNFRVTHDTDWRRVRWVPDPEYMGLVEGGDFSGLTEADIAVSRRELEDLKNGDLVCLGAIVETRCPHCKEWTREDSLWNIIVQPDDDLEALGSELLEIPEQPTDPTSPEGGCSSVPWKSPALARTPPPVVGPDTLEPVEPSEDPMSIVRALCGDDTAAHDALDDLLEQQRRIETSRDAAQVRYELLRHERLITLDEFLRDEQGTVPPPPEGPPNTLEKEGDTVRRIPTLDEMVRLAHPKEAEGPGLASIVLQFNLGALSALRNAVYVRRLTRQSEGWLDAFAEKLIAQIEEGAAVWEVKQKKAVD